MVSFEPEVQPSSVGSGGIVVPVTISAGFAGYPIVKIEVEQLAGSATYTTVELSTDQTFTDHPQRVATFVGLNKTSPVGHTNGKFYYPWDGVVSGGVVYCRLTPETEVNNDYLIRIHVDEEVLP